MSPQASPAMEWVYVVVDCHDPVRQTEFWGALLGREADPDVLGDPDQPHYMGLTAPPGHPKINFQRVPEGKTVKNRLHLDIHTDDLDAAIARIEELGGRKGEPDHRFEYGIHFHHMRDPEDNEFCLVLADE